MNAVLDFVDARYSIACNRFGTLIIFLQSLLQSFRKTHDVQKLCGFAPCDEMSVPRVGGKPEIVI